MTYRHAAVVGRHAFTKAIRGLAVGSDDRLYAVGDSQVTVFDSIGGPSRRWSTSLPAWCVAVQGSSRVYVGEDGQIEIFDAKGRLISTWRHSRRLGRVTAIGFADGDVLAGDAAGRAIRRFDRGGTFLNDIGANNRMQGFLIPNGVVQFGVDDAAVIHAANPGKHRVERYTIDGQLLGHFGRFDGNDPAGFGGCCNPTNVAVAARHVYVTEKGEPRAKVYDFDGNLVAVVATEAFDRNCKNMSIAVDSHGRVYVADTVRLDILAFEPQPERAE